MNNINPKQLDKISRHNYRKCDVVACNRRQIMDLLHGQFCLR